MIYLSLFILSYIVNGEIIHREQGVAAKLPSDFIEFDQHDPIASNPAVQDIVNGIVERNIRRGLTNPATLTQEEKMLILDAHNDIRSQTARGIYEGPGGANQPQACNMNALSWSQALEKIASDWSTRCYFEHNNGRKDDLQRAVQTGSHVEWNIQSDQSVGENLYVSGADPAMNAVYGDTNYGILGGVKDSWCADESKKYTYTPSPGASGTGHYTQVVWADTRYVGCGFHQCTGISYDGGSYSWGKMILTCSYAPAGNFYGQKPYIEGTPCSCCDDDRNECSHEGGLCGGGFNSNYNNENYGGDKTEIDRCTDGLGRSVCRGTPEPTSRPTAAQGTPEPTTPDPTNSPTTPSPTGVARPPSNKVTLNPSTSPIQTPTRNPSPTPTMSPTQARVTDPPAAAGETRYAVRVSTEVVWTTRSYDYQTVNGVIEELMFEALAMKYVGITSSVDELQKEILGPYCANPCWYIYGFNTIPMILEGVTEEQRDDIVWRVNNGTYADELCTALTDYYDASNSKTLTCYRVVPTVESITESDYAKFIGDIDNDGVPFDTFNLESYSGADIFVLLIFLSFICCACWCVGWYSHKKKFQKELEKELNLATNFNQQQTETDIRRQMAANAEPDMFEKGIGRFRNN